MNISEIITSSLVHFSFIASVLMTIFLYRRQQKSFAQLSFLSLAFVLFIWNLGTMLELDYRLITGESVDSPISIFLIDLCYLAICFEPVVIFFLGKSIFRPDWRPSIKYLALFIIPLFSFMMVTTNPLHHLFFKNFSLFSSEAVYGPYFYFHSIYSYGLIIIGLSYIVRVAVRNSGLLSKQFLLILASIIIPLTGNVLYSFGLADLPFSINATLFTVSSICIFIAIIKYQLFTVTSINMRQVVDLVSDAFIQIDDKQKIVDYNNTLLNLFPDVVAKGKDSTLEDFFEKNGFETQKQDCIDLCNQAAANKASANMEITLPDSRSITMQITPFFDNKIYTGSIIIFKNIAAVKSITELDLQKSLKEIEEDNKNLNEKVKEGIAQLEEERQARQSLYNADPSINFIVDFDYNVIDGNPSALKFYGFDNKDDFVNGVMAKIFQSIETQKPDGSKSTPLYKRFEDVKNDGFTSFDTIMMVDDKIIPFHFYLKMITFRGEDVVAAYQTDLREIRAMEQDLEKRDLLLTTINTVATRLISAEEEDLDTSFNESIAMLGRSIDVQRVAVWKNYEKDGELYCTQISDWSEGVESQHGMNHTVDLNYSVDFPNWENTFRDGKCINEVVKNLPENASKMMAMQGIVSVLSVPLFVRDELWGFVGFDDCVKERVFSQMEESTLAAGAMLIAAALFRNEITGNLIVAREDALSSARAKSSFLANMSHEIRTPLNAIVGMANIAKRKTTNEEALKPIDEILSASKHLMELINDILDFSKIESGKMEIVNEGFDIYKAMKEVESLIIPRCAEKNIQLEANFEKLPAIAVLGDKLRMKQVLINLLGNAVKFTPESGLIKFIVEEIAESEQDISLKFSVIDTGIGLAPDQIPNLFKAFEQGDSKVAIKYGGTGLGLAISQNIIIAMGGLITVESEVNKGSTFKFSITLDKTEMKQLDDLDNASDEEINLSGKRILLAEDVEINRVIIIELLSDTGVEIDEAIDGVEALDMFQSSEVGKYNLIFMDIQMPNMDGYQAATEIRQLDRSDSKTIPIIAMTANAFREDIEGAFRAGMDGHLAKPIDIDAVRKLLFEKLRED